MFDEERMVADCAARVNVQRAKVNAKAILHKCRSLH